MSRFKVISHVALLCCSYALLALVPCPVGALLGVHALLAFMALYALRRRDFGDGRLFMLKMALPIVGPFWAWYSIFSQDMERSPHD